MIEKRMFGKTSNIFIILSIIVCLIVFQIFIIKMCKVEDRAFAAESAQDVQLEKADDGYFLIENHEDLENVTNAINSGGNVVCGDASTMAKSANFRLTKNISLNQGEFLIDNGLKYKNALGEVGSIPSSIVDFQGIGNTSNKFSGVFDGGGHTISGYYSTSSPFFNILEGATIHDLHIEGLISASKTSGYIYSATCTTVYNCSIKGIVAGFKSAGFARTIGDNCKPVNNLAEVTFTDTYCAGFVNTISSANIVVNCVANSTTITENGFKGFQNGSFNGYVNCKCSKSDSNENIEDNVSNWQEATTNLNNQDLSNSVSGVKWATWSYSTNGLRLSLPIEKCDVIYYDDQNVQLSKVSVEKGSGITIDDDLTPQKEGFTFVGWDKNNDDTPDFIGGEEVIVESNMTLVAVFSPIVTVKYTVTYTVDGQLTSTTEVADGQSITTSVSAEKQGYTFVGWDIDGDGVINVHGNTLYTVTKDVNFVAVFTPNIQYFSITYVSPDGTTGSVPVDETLYQLGDSAYIFGNTGNLTLEGYIFKGWDIDNDGAIDYEEGQQIVIDKNIILKAIFEEQSAFDTPPTATSFVAGIATWQYEEELGENTFEVFLYDEDNQLLSTIKTQNLSYDFSHILLKRAGTYTFKVRVASLTDSDYSSLSSISEDVVVYKIALSRGNGTTLDAPLTAFANSLVKVSATLYSGYENLIITIDDAAISGASFIMPSKDIVIATTATIVEDYVTMYNQTISQIGDEFRLLDFELIKRADAILLKLVPEQVAEMDQEMLVAAKARYNNIVEEAKEDYEQVKSAKTAVNSVSIESQLFLDITTALKKEEQNV